MNKLVKKLDTRLKKSCKVGNFTSKPRIVSARSSLPIPLSPKWAIKASFQNIESETPISPNDTTSSSSSSSLESDDVDDC